jgi:hypothetical protein
MERIMNDRKKNTFMIFFTICCFYFFPLSSRANILHDVIDFWLHLYPEITQKDEERVYRETIKNCQLDSVKLTMHMLERGTLEMIDVLPYAEEVKNDWHIPLSTMLKSNRFMDALTICYGRDDRLKAIYLSMFIAIDFSSNTLSLYALLRSPAFAGKLLGPSRIAKYEKGIKYAKNSLSIFSTGLLAYITGKNAAIFQKNYNEIKEYKRVVADNIVQSSNDKNKRHLGENVSIFLRKGDSLDSISEHEAAMDSLYGFIERYKRAKKKIETWKQADYFSHQNNSDAQQRYLEQFEHLFSKEIIKESCDGSIESVVYLMNLYSENQEKENFLIVYHLYSFCINELKN